MSSLVNLNSSYRDSRLNTISFCVRVPVLSERRNLTRPNSSGMLLLRAMVPSMSRSLLILAEYTSLAKSKLTLIEIGMIELSRIRIRVNWIGTYFQSGDCSSTMMMVIMKSTLNRILLIVLISQSRIPTFVRGVQVPNDILVSLPVNMTIPNTRPLANTVLIQSVFSRDSFSFLPPASNYDCSWKTASKT